MSTSATKPSILFVPGAWHRAAVAFAKVAALLESAGYTTRSVELPSVGAPEPLSSFEPDVEAIRAGIESACADGSDVYVAPFRFILIVLLESLPRTEVGGLTGWMDG